MQPGMKVHGLLILKIIDAVEKPQMCKSHGYKEWPGDSFIRSFCDTRIHELLFLLSEQSFSSWITYLEKNSVNTMALTLAQS